LELGAWSLELGAWSLELDEGGDSREAPPSTREETT
jgi:hypothetical protein